MSKGMQLKLMHKKGEEEVRPYKVEQQLLWLSCDLENAKDGQTAGEYDSEGAKW